jgi:TRAP-type C4-dicarboxylate transport system permease small subunit
MKALFRRLHDFPGGWMRKTLLLIRDFMEVYIPIVSFIIMFVTFILQVFFRYIINHPLVWSMEIIVICFIWTVEFGACFTMRKKSHVKFTMLYDRLNPRLAAVFRIIGNAIIFLTFLCLVPSSWNQALYESFEKTAALRIPYTVLFLPFVYFLVSIAGYTGAEIAEDIKVLKGLIPDSEAHKQAAEIFGKVSK